MMTLNDIRFWLIRKLAGRSMIVMNADVKGIISDRYGLGGLVYDCTFGSPDSFGYKWNSVEMEVNPGPDFTYPMPKGFKSMENDEESIEDIRQSLYAQTFIGVNAEEDGKVWVELQSYVGLTPAQCRDFSAVLLAEAQKADMTEKKPTEKKPYVKRWEVGDVLQSKPRNDINPTTGQPYETIYRKIIAVRPSGYTWRYPDSPEHFLSEDSNDTEMKLGWEKKP